MQLTQFSFYIHFDLNGSNLKNVSVIIFLCWSLYLKVILYKNLTFYINKDNRDKWFVIYNKLLWFVMVC